MAKSAKKSKKAPKLGALPEWNLNDLYPGPDSPELKWDLENAETRSAAFEADFKGKLVATGGRAGRRQGAGRGGQALRGARRHARPGDVLCLAALCRRQYRSPARQVLWRHAGAHHRGLAASAVLHARAQPHRRCQARRRHGRSGARPLPALDRGRAQGEALSARGPGRGAVPREVGHRLFGLEPQLRRDHRVACASGSAASRFRSSRRSICCRTPTARNAKARRRRWPRPSRRTCGRSR